MSDDDERPGTPKRAGNVTMQIDAFRDQLELLDDAEDAELGDDAVDEAPRSVAPPPLPPRATATADAPSKVVPIAIGVVVAGLAVGAALWVSAMLVEEAAPVAPAANDGVGDPGEAPALEIGPIEIDTSSAPVEE